MNPKRIILHHSKTKDGQVVNWNSIRKYHVVDKQWDDIGYHFGIEKVIKRYETLIGRVPNRQGAHCRGQNHDSLGIVFVGDYDAGFVPNDQWQMGISLVKALIDITCIRRDQVFGDRDFHPSKTCPGLNFDIEAFRGQL